MPKSKTYRWKGKIVTKSVYDKRLIQQKNGQQRRKNKEPAVENQENVTETVDQINVAGTVDQINVAETVDQTNVAKTVDQINVAESRDFSERRRIVELKILGEQLWCVSCKETLSLQNIENEARRGFGSVLTIRCHKCLLLNQVNTGKQHVASDKRSARFDVNTKAVMGALHCGMGWTHMNKLFSFLNVPCFDFKTYKRYEKEVELSMKDVAETSCEDATAKEKQLMVEQTNIIKKEC